MDWQDTKWKIVKEVFPSEIISIIGDILAGIILTILIVPFESFLILILLVPALLSIRGNISGPYIARTSRDIIIGEFNKKSLLENILATYTLSILIAFLIGLFGILLNYFLVRVFIITNGILILIPIISILLTLSISIPFSTVLNIIVFRRGLDPNNVVNPIMTAIDDFFTVLCFYLTIIMLGVP
ncbi:MAG: magnesium transporter [Candidatus Lokiarchaeota archaeon]|nr:magnesium transporter [Candidatus Lokiarchaeota archaeon]